MEGSRSDEFKRLIELSKLDLDYNNLEEHLDDLTKLAARIVGTEVSLVNIIDSYTQWSVADYGIDIQQMPREDSVCRYTIMEKDSFEIKNLSEDDRFREKPYVNKGPHLKYYYGVPLQTSSGVNIGALCVLDPEPQNISPEKKELLKLVGKQVVRRLEALKKINDLQSKVEELNQTQRKVSHDIRNPISGIIGIAQIMKGEIKNERINEVLELVEMIEQGGNSLLELVEDIMDQEDEEGQKKPGENQFNSNSFCQKLKQLYDPQAKSKNIELNVQTLEKSDDIVFSRSMLIQIVGNLITNSIKFTEEGGRVDVGICVIETDEDEKNNKLMIKVEDTGVGMEADKIEEILEGETTSESGTDEERGYGFGLSLVQHLVDKADGEIEITSEPGKGTSFVINLPV
jgi:signal transduction histidine kinase